MSSTVTLKIEVVEFKVSGGNLPDGEKITIKAVVDFTGATAERISDLAIRALKVEWARIKNSDRGVAQLRDMGRRCAAGERITIRVAEAQGTLKRAVSLEEQIAAMTPAEALALIERIHGKYSDAASQPTPSDEAEELDIAEAANASLARKANEVRKTKIVGGRGPK